MFRKLKQLIEESVLPDVKSGGDDEHAIRLATAVLFVEMMGQDDHFADVEKDAAVAAMRSKFALSDEEIQELVEAAEAELEQATDYHQFTSVIQQNFSYEQKVRLIEHLWEVALADYHLDRYEEHLVRKLSELLYVRHSDFIAARHRVEQALKIK